MAVSLKDISKVTNISTCTISQVLNNHPKAMSVRPETRAKILDAAKKLGYCKNELAASIAQKNIRVLAFVTCPMGGVEYTGIIQNGILNTAAACGYSVVVYRLNTMSETEIISKIIGWRVAGVVFHVPKTDIVKKIVDALEKNSIYYGYVNLSNPDGIGVTSDDRTGIEEAIKFLAENGHRKIAFADIGGSGKLEFESRRLQGYRDGLAKYSPEQQIEIIHVQSEDKEALFELLKDIISKKIDGIVCISDSVAATLCNTALKMGYMVPDIFSVIGFGNSVIAKMIYPPLTTIAQDFELMGHSVVNFIIDCIEKKNVSKVYNIMQPTVLKHNQSVRIKNIENGD